MFLTNALFISDSLFAESTLTFFLLLLVCGPVIFLCYQHVQGKRIEYVRANSKLLKEIDQLNLRYHFFIFQDHYQHIKTFFSKAAYDKAQFCTILNEFLLVNENQLYQNMEYADLNAKLYRMYCNEYEKLQSERNSSANYYQDKSYFIDLEDKLFREKIQRPATSFEVVVIKQYTSPQGRNHYSDSRTYSTPQIKIAIAQAKEQQKQHKEQSTQRQAERAKMTDALRYEILKRDKSRCCLCGATPSDGIKLHVDHIKPVSKGGKTEPNNLRTLCDRCNLGKGAKYDPNGFN